MFLTKFLVIKTTVIFFFDLQWHDLGFFPKILIFLGFPGKINCKKILARNLKNPKSWQEMKKNPKSWQEIKKSKIWAKNSKLSKIIQDGNLVVSQCLASWQENQDAKHWETTKFKT